jgi:hypothetical protein
MNTSSRVFLARSLTHGSAMIGMFWDALGPIPPVSPNNSFSVAILVILVDGVD